MEAYVRRPCRSGRRGIHGGGFMISEWSYGLRREVSLRGPLHLSCFVPVGLFRRCLAVRVAALAGAMSQLQRLSSVPSRLSLGR